MAEPQKRPGENAPAPASGGIAARALAQARGGLAYLDDLNPEQRLAVETLDGPVLVLAGAGTGKTRVLTTRIAHIINLGRAHPREILAVTFTNKAAREMKNRIGAMMGQVVEGMPWLGTFHAIGVKILRHHAEMVGLKNGFTILDVDDQVRLLKQILEAENIDEKRWPGRVLAAMIDGWKNRGLTPQQVPVGRSRRVRQRPRAAALRRLSGAIENPQRRRFRRSADGEYPAVPRAPGRARRLSAAVQIYPGRRISGHERGAVSVAALAGAVADARVASPFERIASRCSSGRGRRAKRRSQVLTPHPSDAAARRASPEGRGRAAQPRPPKNICCVGDDDQSIYGWRGAEVDNILRFEKDFPGAVVIRLERNYRSTGHILAAASHLIAYNQGRLGKTLRTEDVPGEKVTVTGSWDSEEEARAIGEEIEDLQRKKHSLNEIAILVRASFQMREFEDRFVTLGLPYRVIGGPRFYERAEIRDALAYLRVIQSPADDLAFERIVNVPRRGLGDATLKQLHDHARARRIPLTEAARAMVETDELKPKPRGSLRDLLILFDRWSAQKDALPHTELAEIMLDESGYTDMWQKDRSADAAGRLENLKELVRSMEEFENLSGFLEHISLVMDRDGKENDDAVNIMTLHSAKGLEFDTVFLPGWEEGLFPHQRSLDETGRAGLEEERRLAHVGLTRARRRGKIFFATNRRIHGMWNSTIPSRFLDELPEAHVEVTESKGGAKFRRHRAATAPRASTASRRRARAIARPGWQRAKAARKREDEGGFGDEGSEYDARRTQRLTFGARHRHLERPLRRAARAAHHRGRTGREIHRHHLSLCGRRPRVSHQIRQRRRGRGRRQQAHHRLRQGRRKARGG